MDRLAVDGFPVRSSFIITERIEERFSEGVSSRTEGVFTCGLWLFLLAMPPLGAVTVASA
jgi:hypothetical protein